MRVQLWSYNYDPEPQGIAPLSAMLAQGLAGCGHDVSVVAAHPHYPEPVWGTRRRPYREVRDGIPVLRLPLWPGRSSTVARIRQEVTFAGAQMAAVPFIPPCDVVIAVTPSFPALTAAMAYCRARNTPWVMWLQDIVTDGAEDTGELSSKGALLKAARRFERASYRSAARVVVVSEAFRENLVRKGVPTEQIVRIMNPSTRRSDAVPAPLPRPAAGAPRILAMGNVGHTQGLDHIVDAFHGSRDLAQAGAELVIAGTGVAIDDVRSRVQGPQVRLTGVLYGDELLPELRGASLGLVSQRAGLVEFNLPSKLMNYMAHGIPVLASVDPESEAARIVREAGAGWVTDSADPGQFARTAAAVLADPQALEVAGRRGFEFAEANFAPERLASRFDDVLHSVVGDAIPVAVRRRRPQPKPVALGASEDAAPAATSPHAG